MITATSAGETQRESVTVNATYVWAISLVAALGGLLFGWDWVVIGGAKPFFQRFFQLTSEAQIGWANSCALIGCLVGALIAGALSDRFGRKRLLVVAALLFAITSLGNALAASFTIFIAWRMLGGVAIGLASNLSPMYIAEIAPAQTRGKLVAINQLTIVIGILLAQSIDWVLVRDLPAGATDDFIRSSWFGQQGWRWMFGLTAAPSLLFFLGMLLVPESPRWLAKNGNPQQARSVLERIGGKGYADAALADIRSTLASEEVQHVRFRDLLEPKMRKVLVLGIVLAVFQQWCGINVIFNYAEEIFRAAGYDISMVLKNIAWTGSVNLVFTFVALGVVDRGGRRPLMLLGAAGLAAIYLVIGFCYSRGVQGLPMLLLVLAAIGCYSMSLAPVTWVVISEIFPNRIRGAAMAVAVACLWVACFILTYTFPLLNQALSPLRFRAADLRDAPRLIAKLKSASDQAPAYVWSHLTPQAQQLVATYDPNRGEARAISAILAGELDRILWAEDIYETNRFAGLKLSSETEVLIKTRSAAGQQPPRESLARLNRLLLQDAFPELRNSQSVGAARTFWLYAATCIAGFVFIKLKLPETKGKSLEQIERELVD
jgi:sugar porter (SP) family MFS transporter